MQIPLLGVESGKNSLLKGDAVSEQLHALAELIGALGETYEASADTQPETAEQLRMQADAVANDAIERLHAASPSLTTPRLAAAVEKTSDTQMLNAPWRVSSLAEPLG